MALASDIAYRMACALNQGPRAVDLKDDTAVVMRLAWNGFLLSREINPNIDAAIKLAAEQRAAAKQRVETEAAV